MRCADCLKWATERRDHYENGAQFSRYKAPEGKGECAALGTETEAEFGCIKFDATALPEGHLAITQKTGAPWDHWVMVPCPDCMGVGSERDTGCHRCSGTGRVRHYDDGYVGEEFTREHPEEKKIRLAAQRDAIIAEAREQIRRAEAEDAAIAPAVEQIPGPP